MPWRELKIILKIYPFKIQYLQKLNLIGFTTRWDFANCLVQMEFDTGCILDVLWAYEADFFTNCKYQHGTQGKYGKRNPKYITGKTSS